MASRARPGFAEGVVVLPSGSEDRQWFVRRSEAFVLDPEFLGAVLLE